MNFSKTFLYCMKIENITLNCHIYYNVMQLSQRVYKVIASLLKIVSKGNSGNVDHVTKTQHPHSRSQNQMLSFLNKSTERVISQNAVTSLDNSKLTRLPLRRHHRREFQSPQVAVPQEAQWVSSSILAVQETRQATLPQEMQKMVVSVKRYGPVESVQLVDSFEPSLVEQQAEAALVGP